MFHSVVHVRHDLLTCEHVSMWMTAANPFHSTFEPSSLPCLVGCARTSSWSTTLWAAPHPDQRPCLKLHLVEFHFPTRKARLSCWTVVTFLVWPCKRCRKACWTKQAVWFSSFHIPAYQLMIYDLFGLFICCWEPCTPAEHLTYNKNSRTVGMFICSFFGWLVLTHSHLPKKSFGLDLYLLFVTFWCITQTSMWVVSVTAISWLDWWLTLEKPIHIYRLVAVYHWSPAKIHSQIRNICAYTICSVVTHHLTNIVG